MNRLRISIRLLVCASLLGGVSSTEGTAQARPDEQGFDSDGVRIRYVDEGEGDPVLLIHGLGGRLEFWEGTGVAPALVAAGFRVIAYDARGHGASDKPQDPREYGPGDVEDAVGLLDHLSIARAHVVGYSRGSAIAARLVTEHPDRIRSVILGGWGAANPIDAMASDDCMATADSLARGAFPSPLIQALLPPGAGLPPAEERAAIARQLAAGNSSTALGAAFRSSCGGGHVTVERLQAASVPALSIVGELDGMAPSARAMARAIEGMEVTIVPGVGHLETPAHPAFATRIVDFLDLSMVRPPSRVARDGTETPAGRRLRGRPR